LCFGAVARPHTNSSSSSLTISPID
jgi:hypothetical protein